LVSDAPEGVTQLFLIVVGHFEKGSNRKGSSVPAPTGRRIPAQGNALGMRGSPFMRSEGTPHRG
jgi:hypothetical protein